jgi:putative SOS response-associated peptidase YedK
MAIVTTSVNETVAPIHHRMPAFDDPACAEPRSDPPAQPSLF